MSAIPVRRLTLWLAVAAVVPATLPACSDDDEQLSVGTSAPPPPVTEDAAPPAIGSTSPVSTPVSTGDVDFPAVFGAFIGGGDTVPDCQGIWQEVPTSPYIGSGEASFDGVWLGQDVQICFAGFDSSSAISVTVDEPDGTSHALTVMSGDETQVGPTELLSGGLDGPVVLQAGEGYVSTTVGQIEPTMPVGRYMLSAEQPGRRAEAAVTVEIGELGGADGGYLKPQNDPASVYALRPGDEVRLLLLYFEPGVTVPLALYRNTGGFTSKGGDNGSEFEFVQELAPGRVGDQGWAFHSVVVPDGLPAAGYCVASIPELAPQVCQPDLDVVFGIVD